MREVNIERVSASDSNNHLKYWLSRTDEERIVAISILIEQYLLATGFDSLPRIKKFINIRKLGDVPIKES